MARADIYTLLPLDEYARIMAIHPDSFNQCVDPVNPQPGYCERLWLQYGWMEGDRIIGRHDIAQAIATAEELIAERLGFWPAPTWASADEQRWPLPARGAQTGYPPIQAMWGQIIEGGRRALTMIDEDAPIVYSASVVGGTLDTATISITAAQMLAVGASREEVAVFFPNEIEDIWRIHYLDITEDAATGNITIVGRRSQFVNPNEWLETDDIDLTVNANFLTAADVYRRYNDPSEPAQAVWKGGAAGCTTTFCADTCQDACLLVDEPRLGIVRVMPGTYSAGTWTSAAFSVARLPDKARLWYYHGLLLQSNLKIKPALAEAIVRLANCFLVAEPCGCSQTKYRWDRDVKMQDINTFDTAMAVSAFGTPMTGAVFAWSTIKRLGPIAGGSALT